MHSSSQLGVSDRASALSERPDLVHRDLPRLVLVQAEAPSPDVVLSGCCAVGMLGCRFLAFRSCAVGS